VTLGQIATKYGISREAIRFYERRGLLPKPKRNSSGYRIYDEVAMKTLSFILNAKEIGFTLIEIKELLSLRVSKSTNCLTVKAKAQKKISELEAKIAYLQRLKNSLKSLIKSCDKHELTATCPLIESLES
jgi:DNA-binding transcriptional MerR regulator